MNCFHSSDTITRITCIPISGATFKYPMNQEKDIIDNSDKDSLDLTITDGIGFDIDISELSAKLSDSSKVETAGRMKTVKLSLNIENSYEHLKQYEQQLSKLQNSQYHLLVTYMSDDQSFIRNDYQTMDVSTKRENDGDVQVSISIQNINGIQPIYKG